MDATSRSVSIKSNTRLILDLWPNTSTSCEKETKHNYVLLQKIHQIQNQTAKQQKTAKKDSKKPLTKSLLKLYRSWIQNNILLILHINM